MSASAPMKARCRSGVQPSWRNLRGTGSKAGMAAFSGRGGGASLRPLREPCGARFLLFSAGGFALAIYSLIRPSGASRQSAGRPCGPADRFLRLLAGWVSGGVGGVLWSIASLEHNRCLVGKCLFYKRRNQGWSYISPAATRHRGTRTVRRLVAPLYPPAAGAGQCGRGSGHCSSRRRAACRRPAALAPRSLPRTPGQGRCSPWGRTGPRRAR